MKQLLQFNKELCDVQINDSRRKHYNQIQHVSQDNQNLQKKHGSPQQNYMQVNETRRKHYSNISETPKDHFVMKEQFKKDRSIQPDSITDLHRKHDFPDLIKNKLNVNYPKPPTPLRIQNEQIVPYKIESTRRKHYRDIVQGNNNQLNLNYPRLPSPPKFIRDQINVSDINDKSNSFMYQYFNGNKVIVSEKGKQDNKNKFIKAQKDHIDVNDINNDHKYKFQSKRIADPLNQQYDYNYKQNQINIPYGQHKNEIQEKQSLLNINEKNSSRNLDQKNSYNINKSLDLKIHEQGPIRNKINNLDIPQYNILTRKYQK